MNFIFLLLLFFLAEFFTALLFGGTYLALRSLGLLPAGLASRPAAYLLGIILPLSIGALIFFALSLRLNLLIPGPTSAHSLPPEEYGPIVPAETQVGRAASTPAISPRGKIVYACQVFQHGDRDQICLMNADGSEARRLTSAEEADHGFPSLAPDGNSVVYSANPSGEFELYEHPLEGSGAPVQLTNGLGDALAPEISPDGRLIVFYRREAGGNSIWVMNRDGSEARQIYGPPEGFGWDPSWSPDGSRILFASGAAESAQLYSIDPDGEALRQITRMPGIRGRNDWSPAGLIATYAGPTWEREIYLIDPESGRARQITDGGNNLAPSFSPDGAWIVFTSYRDHYRDDHGCELYLMRVDGGQLTRLTSNDFCDWQPRWGP